MNNTLVDLLLVDDDEVDREFVRRLLPDSYHVREASLGLAALAMVKAHRPDCILLDWHLPDVDGLHLLQIFSKASIPVIGVTGIRNPYLIRQAMQQGALAFLLKDELSKAVLEQTLSEAMADMRHHSIVRQVEVRYSE